MYKNYFTDKGFTLAEVLVTLSILGIIAALTIPSLVQNTQDNSYKTAYKKAFSVANQAWMQAMAEDKIVTRTIWADSASNATNWNVFKSYFNVAKDCSSNNNAECWSSLPGDEKLIGSGCPTSTASAFIDNSGMVWSRSCNVGCGFEFFLDTNGFKGPNKFGKDRFILYPRNADNSTIAGLPIKLVPLSDYPNTEVNYCPSGGCYYTSWLTGAT